MKKNKKHTISIVEEEVKETESVLSKPISVGMLIVIVFGLLIVLGIAQIHDYYLTATDFELSYLNSFIAIIILLVIFSVLWLFMTEDISLPLLLLIPVSLLILLTLYCSTQSSIEECSINLFNEGRVVNLTEGIGCYSMKTNDIKISSSKIYEEGINCSYDEIEGYIVKDYDNNYYCKIVTELIQLN
jgi:hypothetical protein